MQHLSNNQSIVRQFYFHLTKKKAFDSASAIEFNLSDLEKLAIENVSFIKKVGENRYYLDKSEARSASFKIIGIALLLIVLVFTVVFFVIP